MKILFQKSAIANQLLGAGIAVITIFSLSFISPEKPLLSPIGDEPGGGKSITSAQAQQMIANFPKWKPSSGTKGGYMSKTAIDAMFASNTEATGMYWYMGSDSTGSNFNLIIEPGISSYNFVNTDARTGIFMSETMCPTECGSLGR